MTDTSGGADEPVRPSDGDTPALDNAGGWPDGEVSSAPGNTGSGRGLDRRWASAAVAAALAVGLIGGVFLGRGSVDPPATAVADAPVAAGTSASPDVPQDGTVVSPSAPAPSAPAPSSPAPSAAPAPLREALPAADVELAAPVSIAIPDIGIDQSLIQLGVLPDRTLEVPSNGTDIGWWRSGPVPGEAGGAVIAAHVTYNGGQPAVFIDLPDLTTGAEVRIDREDGSIATYQVTDIEVVSQDAFPNEKIYRLDGPPMLTLITCGGDFINGSYTDSVIVYAALVADTRTGSPA